MRLLQLIPSARNWRALMPRPARSRLVQPRFENIFPYITSQTATNNYLPNVTTQTPLNNGIFKSDYAISAHHHLSGTAFISKSAGDAWGVTATTAPPILGVPQWYNVIGSMGPPWSTVFTNDAQQYSGDWTWTPNSSWVNDFRLGYVFINDARVAGDSNLLPSSPWPNGYGMNTGVTNPLFGGPPGAHVFQLHPVGRRRRPDGTTRSTRRHRFG